jgi:hypothetical protein
MGDVLAEYVDAGGGVVLAVFANASIPLAGRWVSGGYEVILPTGQTSGGPLTLGTVLVPAHPVMAGVTSFDGGTSSYRPTTTVLTAGSTAIANWSDGRVLIAEGSSPRRIDLGFYPPSSDCRIDFWTAATDGALIMANALTYVADTPVTTYCTPKSGLACGLPGITWSGSPSATASSGFTVSASPARANKTGILLYSSAGAGNIPFPSGGHILCMNTPVRRAGPTDSGGVSLCDGAFAIDMNAFAQGVWMPPGGQMPNNPAPFLLVVGQQVNCQWWGRDSVATGSFMSAALEYLVGP